ncbi:MAG: hypothetical protein LBJ38_01360, partial [Oscillospiraceae bacterium]|nr:hypothetical protein [Oscillospiraceae bacterium]
MNRKKRNFKHSLFVVLACCGTLNVLTPATNTVFAIKTVTPATVAGSLVNGREAGSNQRFSLPTEEAICALQGETFTIKPANPSGELTAVVITNGTPKEARTEFSQWAYDVFVKG